MQRVQHAFGIVLFVVVALAAIVAVITVAGMGRAYEQIGRSSLLPEPGPEADPGLETEVRQLVVARNARRVRQGQEPLDVETEVARRLRELAD